jgi:hypothetical protein
MTSQSRSRAASLPRRGRSHFSRKKSNVANAAPADRRRCPSLLQVLRSLQQCNFEKPAGPRLDLAQGYGDQRGLGCIAWRKAAPDWPRLAGLWGSRKPEPKSLYMTGRGLI